MLFRTATSAAILAFAASSSAKPQPYKLAVMPLSGMSLARRDTNGYIPEETVCGDGNTCAEACGGGYTQCASNDAATHCFNPEAGQSCCTDGTGNSCEAEYYCTHDNDLQTWCCPDSMDLAECAAAYSVTGGLETPEPTTSEVPTSTSVSTEAEITTTSTSTSTSTSTTEEETTSTPISTTTPWTSTSVYTPTSTPIGTNSTITSSPPADTTVIVTTDVVVSPPEETTSAEEPSATGAAAVSGVSLSLLIAAAGFVALI